MMLKLTKVQLFYEIANPKKDKMKFKNNGFPFSSEDWDPL